MRNNKGFSFVEIVIVVAIMAIASAILAPQLIKNIERTRLSTDAQSCATIKRCVNATLANQEVWKDVTSWRKGKFKFYLRMSNDGKELFIQGLQDGEDTANEIRGLLGDLKNPKQAGKESYLVIVEVKEKEKKGQKVYTVGSIEV